jgi:hypothetical protein
MRPALLSAAIIFVLECAGAFEAGAQSTGKKSLNAFLAMGKESKRTTSFSSDVSSIYVFWKGQDLEAGAKIHSIWIAEDIGDAAPKDSKILEGEAKVYKADENGSFSLTRPGGRVWPLGKYRVELYINTDLSQVLKFTITPGVKIEVPKGGSGISDDVRLENAKMG